MEKSYELHYGWCYKGSDDIFVECQIFSSKEQRDKHLLNIVHSNFLIIKWYKKIDIEEWNSCDC
jgi:hypothetical protein